MLQSNALGQAGAHTGTAAFAQGFIDTRLFDIFDVVNGLVRADLNALLAAYAVLFIHDGGGCLDLDFLLSNDRHDARGRGRALRHTGRDVLRPLAGAGDEDTIGHRGDRVELGMLLDEPLVGAARDAELLRYFLRVGPRLQSRRKDHHIDGDAPLFASQRIFHLDDELAFFIRVTRRVRDLRDLAAHEEGAFLQHTLVELIIGLVSRAHVDV